MWQKVDPRWFRVGISRPRPCEWFVTSNKDSADYFVEDVKIRDLVSEFYFRSAISKVIIRKDDAWGELLIFTAKPAWIIWKDWATLEKFEAKLKKLTGKQFKVTVKEVKTPELSARIMAEFACDQLENRMSYRRVAKGILQKVMEKGAIGVKFQIWWRLWGVDLSRSESFSEGRIPLQTLRADVDYHYEPARTKYGILWVKVWICKSENVLITKKQSAMDKI